MCPDIVGSMSRDSHVPTQRDTVPSVDREAWAAEVRFLIERQTAGNTQAFARLVGADRRTVNRWKAGVTDVSSESVIRVARAFNMPAGDLLVRAGLLDKVDLGGRR